jgi:hypothetical protein
MARAKFDLGALCGKPARVAELPPLFEDLPPIETVEPRKITLARHSIMTGEESRKPLFGVGKGEEEGMFEGLPPIGEKGLEEVQPKELAKVEAVAVTRAVVVEAQEPKRRSPAEVFEHGVTFALDRSLDNFRRAVNRELTSAFRSNSNGKDMIAVDNFVGELVGDLTALFVQPSGSVAQEEKSLVSKVNSVFEENAKSIRWLFQDAESKSLQIREAQITRLAQMSTSISELRANVKNLADETLQEFEKERFDTTARLDLEQTKARQLERRARTLKLKQADLDATLRHQKLERDSVERLLRQIDESRREWEESYADPSTAVVQKLQKEIELLRSELANETTDEFERSLDQCINVMNGVRENLRDEMCQIDMIERWAMARFRTPVRKGPMGKTDCQPNPPVLLEARERIEALRKQRELSVKQVNHNILGFNENQAQ